MMMNYHILKYIIINEYHLYHIYLFLYTKTNIVKELRFSKVISIVIGYSEEIDKWKVIKLLNADNKNSDDNAKAIAVPIILGNTPTVVVVIVKYGP